MLQRKYLVPAVIAAVGSMMIGGWQAMATQSPQVKLSAGARLLHDSQVSVIDPSPENLDVSAMPGPNANRSSGNEPLRHGSAGLGTLNDQIERALLDKDGRGAANLASQLKDCEVHMMILTVESSQGAPPDADPGLIEMRKQRLLRYERMNAACQTVPGDQKQLRIRLLELAIHQNVEGAGIESFEAGSRDPATLSQVVSDANAGDIKALTTLAMYDIKVFGTSRDQQDAARYALKLASSDAVVGERVSGYLKVAESYGAPNSQFDLSGISAVARARGAEMASKVRERFLATTP